MKKASFWAKELENRLDLVDKRVASEGPKDETNESTTLLISERLNELKKASGDSTSRRRPAEDDRSTTNGRRRKCLRLQA
ncbi:hypothetical protein LWI29_029643 [Acer saccharum]|uniref:Uncharacterized protein n=1 Tax=Acer saccharum TaxID=4024 RepID=A0AA39W3A0_ACESA|nr:hypothetical protein LWI29_029643 [Acer saccharum]